VSTASDDKCVEVKIKDTGKGMSEKTAEEIFDPFFTTKPVGQGTGLGLSISYGIIRRHGGDISVKSELGKGTEFSITIPIAQTGLESAV
jgi:signal transduction histidine kinase